MCQHERRRRTVQCSQGAVARRDRDLCGFCREVGHYGLVGSWVSLGHVWLNGLVERQSLDLMGAESVAVTGQCGVAVVRSLPRPVHSLAKRDVNRALAAEVALPPLSYGGQGVRVFAVDFLADVDGPRLVDQAGPHSLGADDHVEFGPVVENSEQALVYGLALLSIGVVRRRSAAAYCVLNRRVKERVGPVVFG